MAENEEESEIVAQFGNVLRVAMGSGMQIREAHLRQAQMHASERAAEAERQARSESAVAGMVNRELYSREFWRTAGSESIADRVTVAAHLAGTHPEARGAWMHAADVLRNDYGINLEAMNRAHPTSLADRHAALRDALDDYFDRQRLDAEADTHLAAAETEQDRAAGRDDALDLETEGSQGADRESPEQAGEAERAQAQKAEKEADAKSVDEDANLALAERYDAETQQDAAQAQTAAVEGRETGLYQRVTEEQLQQIERHANAPQLALVRARQAACLPQPTSARVNSSAKAMKAKKPAAAGRGLGQGQEAGLSR